MGGVRVLVLSVDPSCFLASRAFFSLLLLLLLSSLSFRAPVLLVEPLLGRVFSVLVSPVFLSPPLFFDVWLLPRRGVGSVLPSFIVLRFAVVGALMV